MSWVLDSMTSAAQKVWLGRNFVSQKQIKFGFELNSKLPLIQLE